LFITGLSALYYLSSHYDPSSPPHISTSFHLLQHIILIRYTSLLIDTIISHCFYPLETCQHVNAIINNRPSNLKHHYYRICTLRDPLVRNAGPGLLPIQISSKVMAVIIVWNKGADVDEEIPITVPIQSDWAFDLRLYFYGWRMQRRYKDGRFSRPNWVTAHPVRPQQTASSRQARGPSSRS